MSEILGVLDDGPCELTEFTPGSLRPFSASTSRPRSRLETMALLSCRQSPHVGRLLDVLLSGCADLGRGRRVLRPLWAEEAIHRADNLIRLVAARGRSDVAAVDDALARDLAALFRSLQTESEDAELPCSHILRNVVADLAALFGGVAGDVILNTNIERVSLPAYKRRALVLAATELVINALLHAFRGRRQGRIEVSLTWFGLAHACLRVSDDGIGFNGKPSDYCCGLAARLADLLETDLVYYRTGIGTAALIVFPVVAR